MPLSLKDIHRTHTGKVSDKWDSYLDFYDRIFAPYRQKSVRILEIGVQNGGSLEVWAKYFPNAEIIAGCDINEACGNLRFEDARIQVFIGDASKHDVAARIIGAASPFDIIIDDGSHRSGDIIRSFAEFFPHLNLDGLYVAEDLHCSYWPKFDGGIETPSSSLSFFRRLTDLVNVEHWGGALPPEEALSFFAHRWRVTFDPEALKSINTIQFCNSLVAVHRSDAAGNLLGARDVVGTEALVDAGCLNPAARVLPQADKPARQGIAIRSEKIVQHYPDLIDDIRDLRGQIRQLRADLVRKEADIRNGVAGIGLLESRLRDARRRPLKQWRRKIVCKVLRLLSKASPPLPEKMAQRFARSAAKRDPFRRDLVDAGHELSLGTGYASVLAAWAEQRALQARYMEQLADKLRDGPRISVAVPIYNPDPALMSEMIDSVLAQSYPNWELCLADDCSTDPRVGKALREYAARDARIRVVFREANGHISAATNSALEIATGEFTALLDHDDLLDRDALLFVAEAIRRHPDARIIYTDEDKINEEGIRYSPHLKPDWNRLLLYENNYISHLGVYQTDLMRAVGGFRKGFEGAQDYDLLLRCVEHVDDGQVIHIPNVLYTWRATPGSTAASAEAKPYAAEAGRRAIEEHLRRASDPTITVRAGPFPFSFRPDWPVQGEPLVSIIIPTRDHIDILRTTVGSVLQRTRYAKFEIIVVDNGSEEPETLAWLARIPTVDSRVRVLRDERPFNYSALNNAAVDVAKGAFIVLMNNDIEVISEDWLDEMLALGQRDGAGCIGAKLYYPDGRIQHSGVVIGLGGVAGHAHKLLPHDHFGYFGRLMLRQEYSAVTAACLLLRRDIFLQVGGLNEVDLAIAFNDVDLCLKVQAAGYHNAWTPYAELVHHESVSRGAEDNDEKRARFQSECTYMTKTWHTEKSQDPAYNVNLSLNCESFVLSAPMWREPG